MSNRTVMASEACFASIICRNIPLPEPSSLSSGRFNTLPCRLNTEPNTQYPSFQKGFFDTIQTRYTLNTFERKEANQTTLYLLKWPIFDMHELILYHAIVTFLCIRTIPGGS